MFEYHGWVVLRAAPRETATEDADLRRAVDLARGLLREYDGMPGLRDVRYINGSPQYHFAGFTNHLGEDFRLVLAGVRKLAEQAPGSFGLIHYWDDEDPVHPNEFRVLVVRRGQITEHADTFLSPVVPTIEDPDQPEE